MVASFWPWLRIRGQGWEWPGVAKLLIQLHLVAFRCISYSPNPHPNVDSSLRWNDGDRGAGMRCSRLRGNNGGTAPAPKLGAFAFGTAVRSAQERRTFNLVPFGSISFHFPSQPPVPVIPAKAGMTGTGGWDARFPPSRARRPSNAVTTYAINVRAGAAMGQWAVVMIRAGALGWRASWERGQRLSFEQRLFGSDEPSTLHVFRSPSHGGASVSERSTGG